MNNMEITMKNSIKALNFCKLNRMWLEELRKETFVFMDGYGNCFEKSYEEV